MTGEETSGDTAASGRPAPPTIDLPATEISTRDESDKAGAAASDASSGAAGGVAAVPSAPARPWQLTAATLAGAIVVLMLGGAFWLYEGAQDQNALEARLAKLEANPPRAGSQSGDDLAARIAKVEAAVDAKNSSVATDAGNRVAGLEDTVKSLNNAVSKLSGTSDNNAAQLREMRAHLDAAEQAVSDIRVTVGQLRDAAGDNAALDRVNSRMTSLEAAMASIRQNIEAQKSSASDQLARRALLAAALDAKAASSAPFATELTALKSLGEPLPPAALEPFAAKGLPTSEALSTELVVLLHRLDAKSETSIGSITLMERLESAANRLVRIRPVGEPAGGDPASIRARAEAKAAHFDIDGALAELDRLPPASRAPLRDWIEVAKSRQAALAAARDYDAGARNALAPGVNPK